MNAILIILIGILGIILSCRAIVKSVPRVAVIGAGWGGWGAVKVKCFLFDVN